MITVANLVKSYAGHRVLDGASLTCKAGTVSAVLGPSGAGKSTLSRCIALLERPDSGVIELDGVNLAGADPLKVRAVRRQLGVVPQRDDLFSVRTVAGNVAVPLERAGVDGPTRRKRVGDLLDLIGLVDKAASLPEQLTPEQRQRVLIARTLAPAPAVLLADDPTRDLEPTSTGPVLTVLERARTELGATVVLATGDSSVARRICDDIAVLDGGRIVEQGTILDLVCDTNSRAAAELLPAVVDTSTGGLADRFADVVLVGFAAIGALLPETASRFDVQVGVIGGGVVRLADTPVARFRLAVSGTRADSALDWIATTGVVVNRVSRDLQNVAA